MTSQIQRRRIFAPERAHLTLAEKAFARAVHPQVRALREYADALQNYRTAATALYNEYEVPAHFRSMFVTNKNYTLEARLEKNIQNMNNRNMKPAQRAFVRASERLTRAMQQLANSSREYRNSSIALRQAYEMPLYIMWNQKNQALENRLKNRTIQTLQRRFRQKQTAKRIGATAAFIGSMSKRSFKPNLTRKIVSSINRRR
jgi:hypothetical protein